MASDLTRRSRRAGADDEFRLRRRFALAYAGLTIVVAVGAAFLVGTVRHRDAAVAREDRLWRPGQVATRDLLGFAVDQETGQRGYVLTGDPKFLEPYTSGLAGSDAKLELLHELFDSEPELAGLVQSVEDDLAAWRAQAAEPEIAAARDSLTDAQRMVAEGPGRGMFEQFRNDVQQLVAAIDTRSDDVIDERNRAFRTVVLAAGFSIAALVASALLILFLSRRWISRLRTTQERLRGTIGTLQAGLLPSTVPQLDRIAIAVGYLPASDDLEVGGDFYDISDRADDTIAITIGDVCGHDVAAAVLTGVVRHTISAAFMHVDDPSEVLEWANRAVNEQSTEARFVTVAHGHLDTASNRLLLALAGHPHPILIPGDGRPPIEIGASGTLLGVTASLDISTVAVQLHDDDQVLFFTDGLTENSRPRLGTDDLLALIARSRARTAELTVARLLENYEHLELRASRDDIALVVIQPVTVAHRPAHNSIVLEAQQLTSQS